LTYQYTGCSGKKTTKNSQQNSQLPAVILLSMAAESEDFRGQGQRCWLLIGCRNSQVWS
jgi:hypothetical protein